MGLILERTPSSPLKRLFWRHHAHKANQQASFWMEMLVIGACVFWISKKHVETGLHVEGRNKDRALICELKARGWTDIRERVFNLEGSFWKRTQRAHPRTHLRSDLHRNMIGTLQSQLTAKPPCRLKKRASRRAPYFIPQMVADHCECFVLQYVDAGRVWFSLRWNWLSRLEM